MLGCLPRDMSEFSFATLQMQLAFIAMQTSLRVVSQFDGKSLTQLLVTTYKIDVLYFVHFRNDRFGL